jgi:trehalose 6-phosphate phosphatase
MTSAHPSSSEKGLSRELVGALNELARVKRLLVALDFDGTLAPEVDDPEKARAIPEARDAVLRLLALPNTRVAMVSGRALASLEAVTDLPDNTLLVGSHGVEIRLDSEDDRVPLDAAEKRRVAALHDVLDQVADSFDQVWLEHLVAVSEAQAEIDDLKIREGKNVLEFSVRSTTKGEAVEHLRGYTNADAVFFAGDDVTDEDAFATLMPDDVGLKSGSGETLAAYRVPGPKQVAQVLALLADYREGGRHEQ